MINVIVTSVHSTSYVLLDHLFLTIYNTFTNERINMFSDKHCHMYLYAKDLFCKTNESLVEDVVIVISECQLFLEFDYILSIVSCL